VDKNVVEGMALRDAGTECKDFHGVYTWTYEKESSIKGLFNQGVNGVLVNSDVCHDIVGIGDVWKPAQAVDYIQNLPGRKFATREDSPFDLSPAITCPTNRTVECTAPGGTPGADVQLTPFFAAATCSSGYCDPLSFSNDAPSSFGLGTTEVTFTASGDANCTSACAAMVTVVDTASPLITCPSDIAQDLVSQQGNLVAFNVAASDTCDASAKVECNPPSGSLFAPGSPTTVTCTAKDASSNQASCSFNVKIFTPQEVIANLEAAVAGLAGLNQGQKNGSIPLMPATRCPPAASSMASSRRSRSGSALAP
jgi:HYR domain